MRIQSRLFQLMIFCQSTLLMAACNDMQRMLEVYGFTPLQQPSLSFHPGTMVWIKDKQPFAAGVICNQAASLGKDFVAPITPTASTSLEKLVQNEFEVGAQYMEIIHGDAQYQTLKRLTLKLSNPMIHTLTDVDVLQALDQRDPDCTAAITARRNADYRVTMIASALKADVMFQAHFEHHANLSAQAQLAMLQNLSLKFGIENARIRGKTIEAEGLYWGVIDDAYLGELGAEEDVPPSGNSGPILPINGLGLKISP